MINTNLLKSKMTLAGDDHYVEKISIILETSRPTAHDKLRGKRDWWKAEIVKMAKHYKWSFKEVGEIFFPEFVEGM